MHLKYELYFEEIMLVQTSAMLQEIKFDNLGEQENKSVTLRFPNEEDLERRRGSISINCEAYIEEKPPKEAILTFEALVNEKALPERMF